MIEFESVLLQTGAQRLSPTRRSASLVPVTFVVFEVGGSEVPSGTVHSGWKLYNDPKSFIRDRAVAPDGRFFGGDYFAKYGPPVDFPTDASWRPRLPSQP